MGSEEFLNQMVEALGTIIDRRPEERPRKMESYTIKKIGCILIFYAKKPQRLKHYLKSPKKKEIKK